METIEQGYFWDIEFIKKLPEKYGISVIEKIKNFSDFVREIETSTNQKICLLSVGEEEDIFCQVKEVKEKIDWQGKFMFEFIEWMESYYEETGHYPPPMRCYNYIMQKLK